MAPSSLDNLNVHAIPFYPPHETHLTTHTIDCQSVLNKRLRICADYSGTINLHSQCEQHPLPTLEELLAKLGPGKSTLS